MPACLQNYRRFTVLPGVPTVAHTIVPAGLYVLQAHSDPYEWEPVVVDIRDDEVTDVAVPLP